MKATLIQGPGSWKYGTCPKVDVPAEISRLVSQYQGEDVIEASELLAAGWTWEGRGFDGFKHGVFDFSVIKQKADDYWPQGGSP